MHPSTFAVVSALLVSTLACSCVTDGQPDAATAAKKPLAQVCELPAIEVATPRSDRPDAGCAASVRALAMQRHRASKASLTMPDVTRCTQLLRGAGRFLLEPDNRDVRGGGGVAMPGLQALQRTLARGRSSRGSFTVPYNAITFAGCGVHFPVYVDPFAPISGFMRSADGRFLVVVHVGSRRYSGAIVPYYLEGAWLSVVDLATLHVERIDLDALNFSAQSISVAVDGERLLVRLRNVWNMADDKRLHLQCTLGAGPCHLEPTLSPEGFPKGGALEVTASGAYFREDIPASVPLPNNALRRTVRLSPDRKHMTYVAEQVSRDKVERTLYVADSSGAHARPVVSGLGLFAVEWLAADLFVFEGDPTPSPALAALRQRFAAEPQLQARVAQTKQEYGEAASEQTLDLLVLLRINEEVEAGRMPPLAVGDAQEERLFEYRTTTGKIVPHNALLHVRLFGAFQPPNLRGNDVVEVPAD